MQPNPISLTIPVSQALDRVKEVLFRPFDAGKWFVIGFCAWLACLGEGGFGGGTHFNFGNHHGPQVRNLHDLFDQARGFVMHNLGWLIPVAAAVLLLTLVLSLLFVWLSSRGQFMFLHCVALNRAEVSQPWHRFSREANSLFLFRLVLGSVGLVCVLPLVAAIVALVVVMVSRGQATVAGVMGVSLLTLLAIALCTVFGLIGKFTRDFVVPVQFLRGGSTVAGWRMLKPVFSANVGQFILYLLFQIVLGIAIFACVAVVVLVTCCIAGCLMAIPYLGTVLLLPVLMFKRAYSLYYLAQYGAGLDVFSVAAQPLPGQASPAL